MGAFVPAPNPIRCVLSNQTHSSRAQPASSHDLANLQPRSGPLRRPSNRTHPIPHRDAAPSAERSVAAIALPDSIRRTAAGLQYQPPKQQIPPRSPADAPRPRCPPLQRPPTEGAAERGNVVHGLEWHPVLALIHQRTAAGSKPGARKDGYKIALAIEGGAMRGVLSAGMAAAIRYLGHLDAFDAIYGSSAGSIVGTYLISGQVPRYGASIYYDDICHQEFINIRRLLTKFLRPKKKGQTPVLRLDTLLDDVMHKIKPLDWEAFWKRNQVQPLKPVASSLTEARIKVLDDFTNMKELTDCLRASARAPGIAGAPVEYKGDVYTDGVIYEPLPYRSALAEDFTHVLVLRTRPENCEPQKRPGIYEKWIAGPYFNENQFPEVAKLMLDGHHVDIYNDDMQYLAHKNAYWNQPPYVCTVSPRDSHPEILHLETKRQVIYGGAREGFAAMYNMLMPYSSEKSGDQVASWVFPDSELERIRRIDKVRHRQRRNLRRQARREAAAEKAADRAISGARGDATAKKRRRGLFARRKARNMQRKRAALDETALVMQITPEVKPGRLEQQPARRPSFWRRARHTSIS